MDDYISREATLKAFKLIAKNLNKDYQRGMQDTIDCLVPEVIADIPTVDVQPVDRWIDAQKNPPPIIDRRSMTSKSVLILRDNGRCSVAYYCNSAEDGDYWTTDDDKTMYCWEEVTHWQPLPEPPKEGDTNG